MKSASAIGERLSEIQMKPAETHFAVNRGERHVLLLQPILIALLHARDIRATPEAVELPGVEHARHVVGIAGGLGCSEVAGGLSDDQVSAVRADVPECAHFAVGAADNDDCLTRNGQGAKVEWLGKLRFVHRRQPNLLPDLLDLLLEDRLIGVHPAVHERHALAAVVGDALNLHFAYRLLSLGAKNVQANLCVAPRSCAHLRCTARIAHGLTCARRATAQP